MTETSKAQVRRFAMEQGQADWLARALHSIPEAVIVTDALCRVVAINSAAEELLGGASCVGKPVAQVLELRDRASGEPVEVPVAEAMASGASIALEEHAVFMGKDGSELFLQGRVSPLREGSRIIGTVLSIHNATQQRVQEAVMAKLLQRQQQNLQRLHALVGDLGHELKNPLGSIVLSAQVLLRSGGDASTSSARRILNSGRRMAKMIDQLVDFARLKTKSDLPLRPRSTNIGDICRELLEELTQDHPECALTTDFGGTLDGEWDTERLRQAISILLGNALEHSVREGRVTVRLDGGERGVVLSIENNGELPPWMQSSPFEPVSSTQRRRKKAQGLGLGLYISHEIVRLHGGTLTANSGGGRTVMVMRLPRESTPFLPRP
jgi:PAS domain S-box-containing protein